MMRMTWSVADSSSVLELYKMSSKQYVIKTLGCKANWYDSQWVESQLQENEWVPAHATEDRPEEVALCIVNSCTVTNEADKQSRSMAKRLSKKYPHAKVVFTGCGAEVNPEKIARSAGVDFVVGNQDKSRLAHLIDGATTEKILGNVTPYQNLLSKHPMDREWSVPESAFMRLQPVQTERTRAFLKIQEGCDAFCTYCIIPYGRGPARSLSIDSILRQIQHLSHAGVREVVLTGTNIGDYGTDASGGRRLLVELVSEILEKTRIERLRVSSLDPVEAEEGLIRLMKQDARFCPHFHISLQSPHDKVLRLMKRRYKLENIRESLFRISSTQNPTFLRPFIGMDIITGFPGEGSDEFEEGLQTLRDLPWDRLHVFPYSEREGTPATRLPGVVPQNIRLERSRILNQFSFERLQERYRDPNDKIFRQVLIEGPTRGPDGQPTWWGGYTPDYTRVMVRSETSELENQIIDVRGKELLLNRAAGEIAVIGEVL